MEYDHVLPALQKLSALRRFHTRWIHEFYVLQKDISDKTGYTEEEQRLCAILKEKPLITLELSERMRTDPHFLPVERLEQDGVLMKSGLTPTDMMILKGDFQKYDPVAANAALQGLGEHPHVEIRTEENRIGHSEEGLLLEIFLHATAIEP